MVGLEVRRKKPLRTLLSSSESLAVRAGLPESRWGWILSQSANSTFASLSPERAPFCRRSARFLTRGKVRKNQLCGDDLNVPHGIDRARHVVNIPALKAANNLDDRINLADVAKELVAEPFSLACSLHETCDVNEFDGGRDDFLRFRKRRKLVQTLVGDIDDANIGLNRDRRESLLRELCACGLPALKSVDLPTLGSPAIPALSIRRGKLPDRGEEASATDMAQPSGDV